MIKITIENDQAASIKAEDALRIAALKMEGWKRADIPAGAMIAIGLSSEEVTHPAMFVQATPANVIDGFTST